LDDRIKVLGTDRTCTNNNMFLCYLKHVSKIKSKKEYL